MQIAVTTPSGNVGRYVVRNLLRAGVRPRVLTRHLDSLDPAVRDRVDARAVDLRDPKAVRDATEGADALYLVLPLSQAPDPIAEYTRVGEGIGGVVVANRIARTVFQSSVGAELRVGAGEIDGLARCEEALDHAVAETGAAVTHLRCGFFFTNLLFELDALQQGMVPVLLPTDQPMPWVAPRDIADVATHLLLRHDWTGRRVQAVLGPNDLSWDDAMLVVSEVIGRTVRAERIDDDAMRQMLAAAGLGPAQVEAMLGMSIGLRDGFVPEQPRDITTTTDTTLGSWSYDVLRYAIGRANSN